MGIEYLFYVGMFLSVFLGGLFLGGDDSAADDTPAPPDPTPTPTETSTVTDLLVADNYSSVETYTDDADLVASNDLATAHLLGAGNDTLTASTGNDFASGGAGDDLLTLLAGDDIAFGGDGNDTILAGPGNDLAYGDAGDDLLDGAEGTDTLYGGAGNDTLLGGMGGDRLVGGEGNDYLSGFAFELANGPTGFDGADTLIGGAGDDILHLGAQDIGAGGAGADTFILDNRDPSIEGLRRVVDFDPRADILELWYTPGTGGDPEFTVEPVGAALYQILQDGQIIAVVTSEFGALTREMLVIVPRA